MPYLSRRRRVERSTRAAQAQRAAQVVVELPPKRWGPSNTPPRVQTIGQKQAKEVRDD